jgi:hypothetical protein
MLTCIENTQKGLKAQGSETIERIRCHNPNLGLMTKARACEGVSHGESCESVFAHGLSVHQKCSNYALINLLFGLCKSM